VFCTHDIKLQSSQHVSRFGDVKSGGRPKIPGRQGEANTEVVRQGDVFSGPKPSFLHGIGAPPPSKDESSA
jgi:hypothetical protein